MNYRRQTVPRRSYSRLDSTLAAISGLRDFGTGEALDQPEREVEVGWLTHRSAVEDPMKLLTRGTTPQRGGTPTNEHNE